MPEQNVYATRVDENHIKVAAGNVRLHFTPDEAETFLKESGNSRLEHSVVVIDNEDDIIQITPVCDTLASQKIRPPFYRIMFNKKQFQDEIRRVLNIRKDRKRVIDTHANYLARGDIIYTNKAPHRIETNDIRWSKSAGKRYYGKITDLTTGETFPYEFLENYSVKLLCFNTESFTSETDYKWAFGISPTRDITNVSYVWWNDEKFVTGFY